MPEAWQASPEWLQYVRAIELQSQSARAAAAQQQAGIENIYGLKIGDLAYQGTRQREAIGADFEGRGMYSSGGRLRDVAHQQNVEGRQRAQMEADRANQVGTAQSQLARDLASYQQQQAERGLSIAQSYAAQQAALQAQRDAQAWALQQYAAMAAAQPQPTYVPSVIANDPGRVSSFSGPRGGETVRGGGVSGSPYRQ